MDIMILTSKQLEELENAHDATGALSDEENGQNKEDVSEAALEWRRQLIEEAAEAIKRAKTRPVEESMTYEVRSLLFDRETRRFGRVMSSVPGYLKIQYLTGGEREWGHFELERYLVEQGRLRPPGELAAQAGVREDAVLVELDRLGIEPVVPAPEEKKAADEKAKKEAGGKKTGDKKGNDKAAAAAAQGAKADNAVKNGAATADKGKNGQSAQPAAANGKTTGKPAKAQATSAKPAATKVAAKKPTTKSTAKRADAPNSYIKKNYKKMSNKELAAATGLSEHTIRRKLGEWGLKRKK